MRIVLALLIGLVAVASPALTAAQTPETQEDTSFFSHKTVYATDRHMWFSVRVALIRLLGGTPAVQPKEVTASQKDDWWGEPVPTEPQQDKR